MSVERSERGALTTNAYIKTQEFATSVQVLGSNWLISDNYTIYRRINGAVLGSNYIGGVWYNEVTASLGTTLNYDLEYYITVYDYNTNNVRFESNFFDNNTPIKIYIPSRNADRGYSYEIRVRRKLDDNGNRGYLVPSDMLDSGLVFKGLNEYNYEEQTLPSDWFQTTTQTIPTYTTQTTMVTTVDYESYLSTLTVPADVRPAIAQLDQLINDLWSLHYIPFVVCFALIMGLAMWLLH